MPVPPIRTWRRPHVYERFSRERPVLLCSSKPPPLIPIVSGTTPHLACSPHLLGANQYPARFVKVDGMGRTDTDAFKGGIPAQPLSLFRPLSPC